VIAVSGVDGSGKSLLVTALRERLAAAGEQVEPVWFRPGMGMAWLDGPARAVKRILGQAEAPAIRQAGTRTQPPPSRQGLVGYVWCLVVTCVYLYHVRAGLRRTQRIALCDRYVLDAEVTLRVFYAGVNSTVPQRMIRALLPEPDLAFYLEVSAERALARKPGDMVGEAAVVAQLRAYSDALGDHPHVHVLDGEADPTAVAEAAWQHTLGLLSRISAQ
jgi:thymidylate kinase